VVAKTHIGHTAADIRKNGAEFEAQKRDGSDKTTGVGIVRRLTGPLGGTPSTAARDAHAVRVHRVHRPQ